MHELLDVETAATMAMLDDWFRARGGRRGRAQDRTPTGGLTYAVTRHATSRAGDPSPHDHVLIANVVEMLDARGGLKALDSAALRDLVEAATMVGRLHSAAHAVALGFVECPSIPRFLASTTVGSDELVVVVRGRHRWAGRRGLQIDATELVATDLVLRELGSGTRQTLVRALSRCGVNLGQSHLELASTAAVKAAVLAGDAPAVLSRLAVSEELANGTFVEIGVRGLDLRRRLRAVWRPGSRPTGAAADLLRQTRDG